MSEHASKPRPASVEAQLRAMANATDRANKPVGLLVLGLVVAVGFGLYALAAGTRWTGARTSYARAQADSVDIDRLIARYKNHKASTPDIPKIFPALASMGSDIENAARAVWGVQPNQPVPGVSVGRKLNGTIFDPPVRDILNLHTVEATISDQPLDKIMQWLAKVEGDGLLGPTFVSSVSLNPANAGWQGSVRFSTYERKQP